MKKQPSKNTKNKKNKKRNDDQRAELAEWEGEGGAPPSAGGLIVETQRQADVERSGKRTAFDATHDSSARGEHRYPDTHQTEAEQQARQSRDDLKRKLGGSR